MRIRNVLQEYEAKLEPPPESPFPSSRAKAEWKVYENGTRQCKVSVSKLDLPDGTILELILEDRRIAKLTVQNSIARYKQESELGQIVPVVGVNQILQVMYDGKVILAGRLYSE
ncbi:MAG: hypothetical protein H7Y59_10540 [Anaerolineales bacterium]|nr:hypothetical protein [Anaerolineales bacterium]